MFHKIDSWRGSRRRFRLEAWRTVFVDLANYFWREFYLAKYVSRFFVWRAFILGERFSVFPKCQSETRMMRALAADCCVRLISTVTRLGEFSPIG
jgi:hypothetical protein